jgi:PAS domain S-box-containing protein
MSSTSAVAGSFEHPHFAQFYEDDGFLIEKVAAFLASSLDAGGAAVVIATPTHRAALRERLSAGPCAEHLTRGSYVELDAQELLLQVLVDGQPDEPRFRAVIGGIVQRASESGSGKVHAFGEMVALACLEGRHEQAATLEEYWNRLARVHRFSLFCGYPLIAFSKSEHARAFRHICDAHAFVHHTEMVSVADAERREQAIAELQQKALALDAEAARRREAEAKLRQRERELVDFVENAAEGLHQVAGDGTIVWANRAELEMLGYSADEYIGRHIADFHVDAPTIEEILRRLTAGETIYDFPARLRCKDGQIKHVQIHSNGRFEGGELSYTRCFTRDVTDRVRREIVVQERNQVLRQAPVAAALMIGPEHRFELVNDLFRQLVGKADIEGKAYLEAFPELAGTALPDIMDRVYNTGEPFVAQEYSMARDRGGNGPHEHGYFKLNLHPIRRPSGEVYAMMAVAVDVTDIVTARLAIEKAQLEREVLLQDLESANRAKNEFLAMLGHELRNPLAPIVTALDLMKRRGDLKTSHEQEVIQRQVQHLIRLVDDLLDISRITRGKVALRKETVELADVIGKAVELSQLLIEQRQHRLNVDVPRAGVRWHGDPTRLAQVVANLLTNAARYTPPGGTVDLTVTAENGRATISVKDSGKGIPSHMLPKIFDLFFQGAQSQERSEGGLGVGLALVKSLVAMHGGEVEARSDGAGLGSEFLIRLPLSSANGEDHPAVEARQTPALADQSRRVLVVDDNADAADLLGELLVQGGHVVKVVYEPAAALDIAASFRPEVAFLDIGLPVMDGYELAAQLRRELAGSVACRMYALTGFGQTADRTHSKRAGLDGHFVKPIDVNLLLATVDSPQPDRLAR